MSYLSWQTFWFLFSNQSWFHELLNQQNLLGLSKVRVKAQRKSPCAVGDFFTQPERKKKGRRNSKRRLTNPLNKENWFSEYKCINSYKNIVMFLHAGTRSKRRPMRRSGRSSSSPTAAPARRTRPSGASTTTCTPSPASSWPWDDDIQCCWRNAGDIDSQTFTTHIYHIGGGYELIHRKSWLLVSW